MPSDGDPRQIRKRIFICACVPAIDLFDDILIHRKRLIYGLRTNRIQELHGPGHSLDTQLGSQSLGPENLHNPLTPRLPRDWGREG